MGLPVRPLLASLIAALGGFLFGFDTAVINGAIVAVRTEFGATPWVVGISVSLALLGAAAGAFAAGPVAERIGRVRAMLLSAALFLLSSIGSGLPFTIWDFTAWRVLGGVAVGAASVLGPTYIAEIAPAAWRGRLGSLQQLAIVIGIFCALLTDWALASAAGGADQPLWLGAEAWRWMFFAEVVPSVAYGIGALWLAESPRYLARLGPAEQKRAALSLVRLGAVESHGDAVAEVARLRSLGGERGGRLSDLRGPHGVPRIVWIGIAVAALQQLVGINVIFYYSSAMWRSAGFGEDASLKISAITGVVNILVTLIAIALVDRIGRRPLLLVGSVGMALSLAAVSFAFTAAPRGEDGAPQLAGALGMVALIAANLYVVAFGCSWGPVVWVLLGEMFPSPIRAVALAVAAAAQWLSNFLVTITFPPSAATLGLGLTYALYTTFAVVSFFVVFRWVRETRGLELEAMA
jgi:sugar porter (SP) family MFS transporter